MELALLSGESHIKGLGWTLFWEMTMRMVPRKDCGKLRNHNLRCYPFLIQIIRRVLEKKTRSSKV